ncbi:GTP pyrophosphokinase family protein [Selenomonas sp. TAMA-11512]|uniref:GTP pyrophosphokinase n=1 Tax=Selenomonas sp. TAMA-11512 TaxID=3095337 RepID=UPI003085B221|nr:GTP pyrophosphokinase family protein [Selenomonas sp. TAMA-11512]
MHIYGEYKNELEKTLDHLMATIKAFRKEEKARGNSVYEHLSARIKDEESMREKLRRKGLPMRPEAALFDVRDAIGIRVICHFIDDVYRMRDMLTEKMGLTLVEEKDYIKNVKPNGYRSLHLIYAVPREKKEGERLGEGEENFYAEVQIRTIAMDTWASLEHEMMYKHIVKNRELLTTELKRCADELAAAELSMQTIRRLIASSSAD